MKRINQMWTSEEIAILKKAYTLSTFYLAIEAQKMLSKAGYKRNLDQIRYKAIHCGFARSKGYKTGTTRMKNGNVQEKQPNGEWLWLSHIVLSRNGVIIPEAATVYHRDGNPLNNDIENLAVKTRPELLKTILPKAIEKRNEEPPSVLDMLLQGRTPRMAGNKRIVWD
jgi:hypothetical protein